jgi:Dynamin central region
MHSCNTIVPEPSQLRCKAKANKLEAERCAPLDTPQVQGQTGIGALALRLNHILVEHIRALLPSLRAHLEEALERRQKELKKYGAMPPGSTSAARYVSSLLTVVV